MLNLTRDCKVCIKHFKPFTTVISGISFNFPAPATIYWPHQLSPLGQHFQLQKHWKRTNKFTQREERNIKKTQAQKICFTKWLHHNRKPCSSAEADWKYSWFLALSPFLLFPWDLAGMIYMVQQVSRRYDIWPLPRQQTKNVIKSHVDLLQETVLCQNDILFIFHVYKQQ